MTRNIIRSIYLKKYINDLSNVLESIKETMGIADGNQARSLGVGHGSHDLPPKSFPLNRGSIWV